MSISPAALFIIISISFLCLIKTFLFLGIAGKKSFLSWFHFSMHEIYSLPGKRMQNRKKKQNRFTLVIISATVVSCIFYLIVF